jgi:hypothetical protein
MAEYRHFMKHYPDARDAIDKGHNVLTRWWREKFPAPAGNRTLEPRSSIRSPALYQLSYHDSKAIDEAQDLRIIFLLTLRVKNEDRG